MAAQLFIGRLSKETKNRDLENVFLRYGKLLRCDVKNGYGFVEYEDARDAEEAIEKEHDRRLLGSRIAVEWAKGSIGDKNSGSNRGRDRNQGYQSRYQPARERGRPSSPVYNRRYGGREDSYRQRSPRQSFGGYRSNIRDRSPFGDRGRADPPPRRRSFSPHRDYNDTSSDRQSYRWR